MRTPRESGHSPLLLPSHWRRPDSPFGACLGQNYGDGPSPFFPGVIVGRSRLPLRTPVFFPREGPGRVFLSFPSGNLGPFSFPRLGDFGSSGPTGTALAFLSPPFLPRCSHGVPPPVLGFFQQQPGGGCYSFLLGPLFSSQGNVFQELRKEAAPPSFPSLRGLSFSSRDSSYGKVR